MIDSSNQLGTVSSSVRFKRDIEPMDDMTNRLMQLSPVIFRYNEELDPSATLQYGLVAEEVAEVMPELVIYNQQGQPETVRYHWLAPMLLNELQKKQKELERLEARLAALEERLEAAEKR